MTQTMKRFQPTTTPTQEDGLLSPQGAYYPCGYENHDACSMDLEGMYACELEDCGWVHISDSWLHYEREFTQPQIDTLFDMCMVNPYSRLGRNIASAIGMQPA